MQRTGWMVSGLAKSLSSAVFCLILSGGVVHAAEPLVKGHHGIEIYKVGKAECSGIMKVTVKAPSSAIFTDIAERYKLEGALGLARNVLNMECAGKASVEELMLEGEVSGQTVYTGLSSASQNWALTDLRTEIPVGTNNNAGKTVSVATAKKTPDSPARKFSNCDRLAAHPADKNNDSGYGLVKDEYLTPDAALEACLPAIEADPENPRYQFNVGRILYVSELYDEATEYFNNAKALTAYPAADYYLLMMQLQNEAITVEDALPQFQELASGFSPAQDFITAYTQELAAAKAEEEAQERAERAAAAAAQMEQGFTFSDVKIADNSFKYPNIFNILLSKDLLYEKDHSIVAVVSEKILAELQPYCYDNQISKADIRAISHYIDSSPNSEDYKAYARKNSVDWNNIPVMQLFGGQRAADQMNDAVVNFHMNDKVRGSDDFGFAVSSDVSKLMKRYDCSEPDILAMISNIKHFIDTAPPYNTVSKPYWEACMSSEVSSSVGKSQFCGCFLDTLRGGGLGPMSSDMGTVFGGFLTGGASYVKDRYSTYKIGHELLADFTGTANEMMKQHSDLRKCTQPKDDSFRRFMNGETDSYGRPIRR